MLLIEIDIFLFFSLDNHRLVRMTHTYIETYIALGLYTELLVNIKFFSAELFHDFS